MADTTVPELTAPAAQKVAYLRGLLAEMGRALVAYSGGVDSALLAAVGHEVLGENCLAVTADSETLSAAEGADALALARERGWNHRVIRYSELAIPGYAQNPTNRCYFCKDELFNRLEQLAAAEGYPFILDGSNWDDGGDHRPGRRATREHRVRSPLAEARMTKEDIREAARDLYRLPIWDKPSFACLSSRIPYGETITSQKLAMVAAAEDLLRQQGLRQFRVRHGGEHHARIEVPVADLARVLAARESLLAGCKSLGYLTVSLDLEGYRTGSLNAALPAAALEREREPAPPAETDAPPSPARKAKRFQPELQGKGVFVLYADGASRGNPGPAASAVLLYDDEGRELERSARAIGKATNNHAEYVALLSGLARALELGARRLHVFMDSELVVKQMNGQYRVKHPDLQKLFGQVKALRARLEGFSISHIRREKNWLADELAGKALEGEVRHHPARKSG